MGDVVSFVKPKGRRRIVQIVMAQYHGSATIVVLDSQGVAWRLVNDKWKKLPALPEDRE